MTTSTTAGSSPRSSPPRTARSARPAVASLGACYKQLNSSVGQFGNFTLQASTSAVESSSIGDTRVQDDQRHADRARPAAGRARAAHQGRARSGRVRGPAGLRRARPDDRLPGDHRLRGSAGSSPVSNERRSRTVPPSDVSVRAAARPSRRVSDNGPVESQVPAGLGSSQPAKPREVVILGSTGSIGTQALDIVRRNPGRFRVVALAAGGGHPDVLASQAAEFGVAAVAVASPAAAAEVQDALRCYFVPNGPGYRPATLKYSPDRTRSARWPRGRVTWCSTA